MDLGEKLGLLVAKSRIRTSVLRKGFETVKKPPEERLRREERCRRCLASDKMGL